LTAKGAKHRANIAKKSYPVGSDGNVRASRLREKPLERKRLPGFPACVFFPIDKMFLAKS
jgi:hypothetical protein